MWKTINPGEKISLGNTVRYRPSSNNLSYKEKIYLVVKIEQHYFEIVVKPDNEELSDNLPRRIIKYMDIGYHLHMEVWMEATQKETVRLKKNQHKM